MPVVQRDGYGAAVSGPTILEQADSRLNFHLLIRHRHPRFHGEKLIQTSELRHVAIKLKSCRVNRRISARKSLFDVVCSVRADRMEECQLKDPMEDLQRIVSRAI